MSGAYISTEGHMNICELLNNRSGLLDAEEPTNKDQDYRQITFQFLSLKPNAMVIRMDTQTWTTTSTPTAVSS
jgi:hypothetical protein